MAEKTRVFVYMGQEYPDPGASFSEDQVLAIMSHTYGNLAGGSVKREEGDERIVVTLEPRPKRLGLDVEQVIAHMVKTIAAAPPFEDCGGRPYVPHGTMTLPELWAIVGRWYLNGEARETSARVLMFFEKSLSMAQPTARAVVPAGI